MTMLALEWVISMHKVGEWVLDKGNKRRVRILEIHELWDYRTFHVYEPVEEYTYYLAEDSVEDIEDDFDLFHMKYLLTASRIKDEMGRGILTSVGDSIIPLPHQIYALNRALSDNDIRYLIADEVGLGKTIEAGLIIKELKARGLVKKTLIVAPKGLITQWHDEMKTKFNEDFKIILPEDLEIIKRLYNNPNPWENFQQVICSMDSIKPLKQRHGWDQERVEKYNKERIESLLKVDWDLIVIDEAHRVGGSSSDVARHKMARALADVCPYLLLLTATPHQGKTEPFLRLIKLLDKGAFPGEQAIVKEQVAPYVIRTEKREAIDADGNRLFKDRVVTTIDINWEKRHELQRCLYEEVTGYVAYGYDRARREKKYYIGFLMILMQRLVTSSTRAIREYLERRLDVLEGEEANLSRYSEEDFYEADIEESSQELVKARPIDIKKEKMEIERLLSLAKLSENQYLDVKAEQLLDTIFKLGAAGKDSKILLFTEFIATQKYLKDILEKKGFKVTVLNGSMSLEERNAVLKEFKEKVQILISTDAGGEGLNLQFCHIVINYDLPWNPMKIEQRIGRVDRIGQEEDVQAYNFLLKDTVEGRVREVLEEKLAIILEQFGIDKMGDILDSTQSEMDFTDVYIHSIMNPKGTNLYTEKIEEEIRERTARICEVKGLLKDEKTLDKSMVSEINKLPIPHWTRNMYANYQFSKGQEVNILEREVIDFNNSKVQEILQRDEYWINSGKIPILNIAGITYERGYWSLWEIRVNENVKERAFFPLFLNENYIFRGPSAKILWDALIDEQSKIHISSSRDFSEEDYMRIHNKAEDIAYNYFQEIKSNYEERLGKYKGKHELAFKLRRDAMERIGLEEVKRFRIKKLEEEEKAWREEMDKSQRIIPVLRPIYILGLE